MLTVRPAQERGHGHASWLDSYHSFSFGDYHDRDHMGFRALRVINEDYIAPGGGFPTHAHKDMEIITYMLDGALQHRDSLGNGSVIRPGEIQRMSAGVGIEHSEFNASRSDPAHLLQIWLRPGQAGLAPGYEQITLVDNEGLELIAGPSGGDGAVTVHQDVWVYRGKLAPGQVLTHPIAPGRHAWVQVARGQVGVNGVMLTAGDGLAISDESKLTLNAGDPVEFLLFDLA